MLSFFYFFVQFYTDHIQFHILIMICEFVLICRIWCERENCEMYEMFVLCASGLLCNGTLKPNFKNLNFFPKNLGFPALIDIK